MVRRSAALAGDLGVGRTIEAVAGAWMDEGPDRQWRVVGRLVLVACVGAVGWMGFDALAKARDAAASSCLSSVHERLQRSEFLWNTAVSAEWETWSSARTREALAAIGSVGDDCDASPDARWKGDLRIRARQGDHGKELGLWLASRPRVFSGQVNP
jgi:hypothetical protein